MRATIACLLACLPAATTMTAQTAQIRPGIRTPGGPAVPPQQQLPTDCTADGTVVNSITGQLLPRANVTLNSANGNGTSTDATGKWTISNIQCGPAIFSAEKDGYIQNTYGRSPAQVGGPGFAPVKPLVLVSGSAAHDLKIELMPESILTGRVLDDAGDPAANAQVRGMRSIVQNGKRTMQVFGSGNADSSGTYRIGGLTPGRYIFCATYNRMRYPVGGGSPTTYAENCFPGPVSGGAANGLQIEGGKEVHADFALSAVTGVHVRGTIAGMPQTASNANGTAANGGMGGFVQMFRSDTNGGFTPGGMRPQTVRDGRFDFPNVTPGSYTLRANMPGAGQPVAASASIEVGNTDLDGVSLMFQAGAPVTGTVRIEDVSPVSAQPNQQAADPSQTAQTITARPPVNVNLNAMGGGFGGPVGRIQWDAEHKSFSIPDVQPGKYRINVTTTGGGYFVKTVMLHDQEVRDQELTVNGPTGPIEILLSNESGGLQGTVTDDDGKPAASQIMLKCGSRPMFMGRSADDGTIRMQNLPAGPCKAWAFDDGRNVEYADDDWMRRYAGSGVDVTITSGATAQVSLGRRVVPQ